MSRNLLIDCHKCVHYFVTWDENFPHGCRAMGFKSWQYPINEVRRADRGRDCLLYQERQKENRRDPECDLTWPRTED